MLEVLDPTVILTNACVNSYIIYISHDQYIMYIYNPRTHLTSVLIGKDNLLGGLWSKIEVIKVLGIYWSCDFVQPLECHKMAYRKGSGSCGRMVLCSP